MDYALISGASKGIGKALAYELAGRKFNLLLTARSESLLDELANDIKQKDNVDVQYLATDLSLPQSPEKIANWCTQNNYSLKILINNAGFGLWGLFDRLPIDGQLNMMQLNMASLVGLTYHLLPNLKNNKEAYILNVSSVAAYQAIPAFTIYAATKSFVLSFSRGLRHELSKTTVKVSCLCPGPTESSFLERAEMMELDETAKKFNMSSEEVAKIAVKGMLKGKAEIVPGLLNKATKQVTHYLPKNMMESLVAKFYMKE
ncbi:SDR family oxidoreductase [bacterium AH-315-M05]|nr:SDR family oxidoreductase [bacterium AH-315-M05]